MAESSIDFSGALEGTAELTRKLKYLHDDALDIKILRATSKAAMKPAYDLAKQLLPASAESHLAYKSAPGRPVLPPGYARTALRVITSKRKDNAGMDAVLGVRKLAFYAVQFVELGTSKMGAHPWLRPAFASTAGLAVEITAAKFRERVLAAVSA